MVRAEITFVDTNVLVYAHDRSDERRQAIAMTLLEQLWADGAGRISVQVLQEFYAVSTRKLNPPMSRADAREIVALYAAWPLVLADPTLILNASRIEEVHQLSFWDGLIVEAARRAGATRLATEDLKDGAVIEGVQVENPFRPG